MNILSTFVSSSSLRHKHSGLSFLFIIFIFKDLIILKKTTYLTVLGLSCSMWALYLPTLS